MTQPPRQIKETVTLKSLPTINCSWFLQMKRGKLRLRRSDICFQRKPRRWTLVKIWETIRPCDLIVAQFLFPRKDELV